MIEPSRDLLSTLAQRLLDLWPDDSARPLSVARANQLPINTTHLACAELVRAGLMDADETGYRLTNRARAALAQTP